MASAETRTLVSGFVILDSPSNPAMSNDTEQPDSQDGELRIRGVIAGPCDNVCRLCNWIKEGNQKRRQRRKTANLPHQMSELGEVTFRSANTAPKRAEAVARTVKRRDAMASFEGGKATAGQHKYNVDDRGREAKRRVPSHETEPALAGPS